MGKKRHPTDTGTVPILTQCMTQAHSSLSWRKSLKPLSLVDFRPVPRQGLEPTPQELKARRGIYTECS